jgi:hypothetical protein
MKISGPHRSTFLEVFLSRFLFQSEVGVLYFSELKLGCLVCGDEDLEPRIECGMQLIEAP